MHSGAETTRPDNPIALKPVPGGSPPVDAGAEEQIPVHFITKEDPRERQRTPFFFMDLEFDTFPVREFSICI